jgi:tRNA(Ile)-lysidine synthase
MGEMADAPFDLMATLRATVTRRGLFTPGQTAVVGVSGGPDSTALLHALGALREELGITLVAAHLHHGFRGAEADADADYVAELAASLQVSCHRERVDVPGLRRRRHLSAQEAAREARHSFLRRVATEVGAERIALGHTRDDRIETILLNLLRGTGLDGLSGFPPKHLPLVRPLYDVSRAQVEAYCAAYALQPRLDSSNAKTTYLRNRIRAELLPTLAAYYNERVSDALLRLAELASADSELLEELAADALESVLLRQDETGLELKADAFQNLPVALRRRVLRQSVLRVRGHLQNVGFEILERLLQAVAQGRKEGIELPPAGESVVRLTCGGETIHVQREAFAALPVRWVCDLPIPGRTALVQCGLIIETAVLTSAAEAGAFLQSRRAAGGERRSSGTILFRLRDVTLPVVARSWRPGDRIRPHNLGGTKKLQDLFTDRKIPKKERARIPVLVAAGGEGSILAVGGLQADEKALRRAEEAPDISGPEDAIIAFILTNLSS